MLWRCRLPLGSAKGVRHGQHRSIIRRQPSAKARARRRRTRAAWRRADCSQLFAVNYLQSIICQGPGRRAPLVRLAARPSTSPSTPHGQRGHLQGYIVVRWAEPSVAPCARSAQARAYGKSVVLRHPAWSSSKAALSLRRLGTQCQIIAQYCTRVVSTMSSRE